MGKTAPKPAKKPAKKAAKKSPARTARRKATAKKVVSGKPVSTIAKEHGVSRATAYRDVAAARYEIARVLDSLGPELDNLVRKMLLRCSEALDAERIFILKAPEEPDEICTLEDPLLGADHPTRMKAVAQIQRLFILGRPAPQHEAAVDKPITKEQFEQLLQRFLRQP